MLKKIHELTNSTFFVGRHSCLWCTIIASEMKLPKNQRSPTTSRTREHLQNCHKKKFIDDGADIKRAKNCCNVIQKAIFEILIDQV